MRVSDRVLQLAHNPSSVLASCGGVLRTGTAWSRRRRSARRARERYAQITGAEPVPVPPPIPAVTKTISASDSSSRIRSSSSSAALRPISGLPPVPRPRVISSPIESAAARDYSCSAWMSVFTAMKSTLRSPTLIMWVDGIAAASTCADYLDPRTRVGITHHSIITEPPTPL